MHKRAWLVMLVVAVLLGAVGCSKKKAGLDIPPYPGSQGLKGDSYQVEGATVRHARWGTPTGWSLVRDHYRDALVPKGWEVLADGSGYASYRLGKLKDIGSGQYAPDDPSR